MTPILQRRLILVLGKGGVGRSTVAASIASATAKAGRRTLLFEANAKDRFGEFFACPEVGPKVSKLGKNLFAVNTTPAAALEEYGLMILRFRRVYKMVFENRITEAFIKAIPGVEDYAVLGKAWFHTKERKGGQPVWDTVVFDMAASGHSLAMLRIPSTITNTVPEGPLTRDAREIQSLLADEERTAIVMVTMAEDMPTSEAIELTGQLKTHLGIGPSTLVVNQLYDKRFPERSPQEAILGCLEAEAPPGDLAAITEHGLQHQSRRKLGEHYLGRLKKALGTAQLHLPRLFVSRITKAEIDAFSESLAAELP
ncbi:MAG: ArsA family ATPase [Myxococcales bacterium]|nr:ArsA family ATPase [Myxococcales bacterium]